MIDDFYSAFEDCTNDDLRKEIHESIKYRLKESKIDLIINIMLAQTPELTNREMINIIHTADEITK